MADCMFSCVWLFVTPWAIACQASLSMGIFQATILEWAAVSFSRGSDLPDPGNKPESPAFQEDSLRFHHLGRPRGQTSSLKKTLSLSRNWGSFYKQEGEGPILALTNGWPGPDNPAASWQLLTNSRLLGGGAHCGEGWVQQAGACLTATAPRA